MQEFVVDFVVVVSIELLLLASVECEGSDEDDDAVSPGIVTAFTSAVF